MCKWERSEKKRHRESETAKHREQMEIWGYLRDRLTPNTAGDASPDLSANCESCEENLKESFQVITSKERYIQFAFKQR